MHISEEAANATPQLTSETKDPTTETATRNVLQGGQVTSDQVTFEPAEMDDLICVNSGPLSDITEMPALAAGDEANDNVNGNGNPAVVNDNDAKEDVGVLMTVPSAMPSVDETAASASVKRPVTVTTSMTSASATSVVMSETSSSVIGMTPTSPRSITTTSMSASGKCICESINVLALSETTVCGSVSMPRKVFF